MTIQITSEPAPAIWLHFQNQVSFPVTRRCIKALEGEFNCLSMYIYKSHRQHFKHALDDIRSVFSMKFCSFGWAFEGFLNTNFMAVLPARERQVRLYSKLKATQGSRPIQSTLQERRKSNVNPHRGQFLHIWQAQSFSSCNIFTTKHNFCRAAQTYPPVSTGDTTRTKGGSKGKLSWEEEE